MLTVSEISLLQENRPSAQEDHSLMAGLLQSWWNWVAARIPLNVAPNTLTVLGSLAMIPPTILQLMLAPDLRAAQPWWACLLSVLGIFLFQTLDAVDGKQARKTKTSSPLGSWLDHALDVLTMQMVFFGVAASMGIGLHLSMTFLIGTILLNNYLLHWEVHHTQVLFLGNGVSITEAQILCIGIHLLSAFFGTAWWQTTPVILHGLSIADAFLWIAVVLAGWTSMIQGVVRAKAAGACWRSLMALRGQIFLTCLLLLASLVFTDTLLRLFYMMSVSLMGTRLIAALVLDNLLDRKPSVMQWTFIPLAVSMAIEIAAIILHWDSFPCRLCAYMTFGFSLLVTLSFLYSLTRQLAHVLGVKIFSITPA